MIKKILKLKLAKSVPAISDTLTSDLARNDLPNDPGGYLLGMCDLQQRMPNHLPRFGSLCRPL